MRREDVVLNEGVRLVLIRQDNDVFLRLLVPKNGTPTFLTPKLPLDPLDHEGLAQPKGVYRCFAGTMLVLVDSVGKVIVQLGDITVWGQRQRLTEALDRIAV